MAVKDRICTVCGSVIEEKNKRIMCYHCYRRSEMLKASASAETYLRYKHSRTKSRAKDKGFDFDLSLEDLKNLYKLQDGFCALSGLPMTHSQESPDYCISIDRIDNDKGYTKDNVKLVCFRANVMRNELTLEMFNWWVRQIAK